MIKPRYRITWDSSIDLWGDFVGCRGYWIQSDDCLKYFFFDESNKPVLRIHSTNNYLKPTKQSVLELAKTDPLI